MNVFVWIFYYFKLKNLLRHTEEMKKTHKNIELISRFKYA